MSKNKSKTLTLVTCALLVALATALSFVKLWESPLGGAVTLFSMVPILMIGFIYGPSWGFASAFVYSALQLVFGLSTVAYVPTPAGIAACVLLDYIVPFTLLGISGFFRKKDKTTSLPLIIAGSFTACAARFLSHFLSGGIIWYEITKNGAWNDYVFKYSKWIYSLIYQAIYLVPETILVLVATPAVIYIIKTISKNKVK